MHWRIRRLPHQRRPTNHWALRNSLITNKSSRSAENTLLCFAARTRSWNKFWIASGELLPTSQPARTLSQKRNQSVQSKLISLQWRRLCGRLRAQVNRAQIGLQWLSAV